MKWLLISLIIVTFSLNAQTITSANLPIVGSEIIEYDGSLVDTGSAGTGQVWDFDAGSTVVSSVSYQSPVGSPYQSDYPASNLALFQSGSWSYYKTNVNSIHFLGNVSSSVGTSYFTYDPYQYVGEFPMQYGDTFSHHLTKHYFYESVTPGLDSIVGTYDVHQFSEIDASGTLTSPTGTYSVLREKRTQTEDYVQTSYTPTGISTSSGTIILETFYWWTEQCTLKTPVAIFNKVTSITSSGTTVSTASSVYEVGNSNPTTTSENHFLKPMVYPNPTLGVVTLEGFSVQDKLEVLDLSGKLVETVIIQKTKQELSLPKGRFLLKSANHTQMIVVL